MRMHWVCLSAVVSIAALGCGDPRAESSEEAAGSSLPPSATGLAAPERHCVGRAQAVKPGESLPASSDQSQWECFDTFSEAISFATKGAVRLPATAKPADLEEEDLKVASAASGSSDYVIGIEYTDAGFSGNGYIFTAPGPCGTLFVGSLPYGVNDTISSAQAFSGCNNSWHYENFNGPLGGGAQVNCGPACSYIGDAMNDRTSSIFWTQ